MTGLHTEVRKYVLDQAMAQDVLDMLVSLVGRIAPPMLELKSDTFSIALGCTGGQHRSPAMVEALADRLEAIHPQFKIRRGHRELANGLPKEGSSRADEADTTEDGMPLSGDADQSRRTGANDDELDSFEPKSKVSAPGGSK